MDSARLPHRPGARLVAAFLYCVVLLFLIRPASSHATLTDLTLPGADAEPVTFGMHIEGVHSLDFTDDTYTVSGFVWWRFRSPAFDPLEAMQIVGAREVRTGNPVRLNLSDGTRYVGFYVFAVINQNLDPANYPFDAHKLRIAFETPYPASELRLVPDTANTRLSDELYAPGWNVSGIGFTESTRVYKTDFGIPSLGHHFSRAVIALEAKRDSTGLVFDSFIGFFVSAMLCFGAYFINPSLLGPRATLIASATIAAVTNKYLINAQIAPSMRSQLADSFALGAFLMILTLMIMSVICERMMEAGKRGAAMRLNRIALGTVAVLYVISHVIIFSRAIWS